MMLQGAVGPQSLDIIQTQPTDSALCGWVLVSPLVSL